MNNLSILSTGVESSGELHRGQEMRPRECFVVYLDFMGFKDRVARTPHEELHDVLHSLKDRINSVIEVYDDQLSIVQFSDSILLYSTSISELCLRSIAEVASRIMQIALQLNFVLKGALSKGIVTCDESKQLYFGQPIIDAYLLEEEIYYYGILVHHSAEEDVVNLKAGNLFRDTNAILKKGKIRHYEILWYVDDDRKNESVEVIIQELTDFRKKVSSSPRKYVDNTNEIIQHYCDENGFNQ